MNIINESNKHSFMSKKYLIISTAVIFALILFYPYQSEAVPEWTLKVIDEAENPVPNIRIIQSWKDYSLEMPSDQDIDKKFTDQNGYVTFPSRKIRASLAKRGFSKLWERLFSFLPHTSFGVRARVSIPCSFDSEAIEISASYDSGKSLSETLIVTPRCAPEIKSSESELQN